MPTFDPNRSELEQLVQAGEFSAAELLRQKREGEVLCVITVPSAKAELLEQVTRAVRKTDYVRSAYGAIQIIGWTSKEGAHKMLRKVRDATRSYADCPKDIHCTTIREGSELLSDSQVARIALGLEKEQSSPYLSSRQLAQSEIVQYAGLIRALHPKVFDHLKVVIAKSSEKYDQLDWTKTPHAEGFIPQSGPHVEGSLANYKKEGEFVVGLEHDGEKVRYDAQKKMLVRTAAQNFYNYN